MFDNKKPAYFYYFLAFMAIMLLNSLLFPAIQQTQVKEVDYGTFLTQVEEGRVTEVKLEKERISYAAKDDAGKASAYVTGALGGSGTGGSPPQA